MLDLILFIYCECKYDYEYDIIYTLEKQMNPIRSYPTLSEEKIQFLKERQYKRKEKYTQQIT
jgi:hypothetical protein